ncbi:hypothetical protein I4641_05825 [Waterburya agarophytonicola K14]|uniref:Lipoprotein n=1 Tax=Waterburya agarophytonicola KI4 TaxID=2874699 RepID=A0A964BPM8_9CYAN|nr:hypothetical protein [Waterburya agarophytonicola]MCC0176496.1 hypothetical protein [Waterburya agarophytonicola KI4]
MRLKRALISLIIIALSSSLIGCGESISSANDEFLPDNKNIVSNSNIFQNSLTEKLIFKRENGSEDFSFIPKSNGIKLEGIQGETIVNLTVDINRKIQIQTSAGSILSHVLIRDNSWTIEDGEETEELYTLQQQTNGDYKLESGDNTAIYQIKKRDYGLEIETPDQKSLYKVKHQDNKQILQDINNKTVLETKSDFPLLAIACYGFEVLDEAEQTGLAYAISLAK